MIASLPDRSLNRFESHESVESSEIHCLIKSRIKPRIPVKSYVALAVIATQINWNMS